jgi:hypothetical protein
MFLAGVGAGPVYKLLDKKGLGTDEFPKVETTLVDGEVSPSVSTAAATRPARIGRCLSSSQCGTSRIGITAGRLDEHGLRSILKSAVDAARP